MLRSSNIYSKKDSLTQPCQLLYIALLLPPLEFMLSCFSMCCTRFKRTHTFTHTELICQAGSLAEDTQIIAHSQNTHWAHSTIKICCVRRTGVFLGSSSLKQFLVYNKQNVCTGQLGVCRYTRLSNAVFTLQSPKITPVEAAFQKGGHNTTSLLKCEGMNWQTSCLAPITQFHTSPREMENPISPIPSMHTLNPHLQMLRKLIGRWLIVWHLDDLHRDILTTAPLKL